MNAVSKAHILFSVIMVGVNLALVIGICRSYGRLRACWQSPPIMCLETVLVFLLVGITCFVVVMTALHIVGAADELNRIVTSILIPITLLLLLTNTVSSSITAALVEKSAEK